MTFVRASSRAISSCCEFIKEDNSHGDKGANTPGAKVKQQFGNIFEAHNALGPYTWVPGASGGGPTLNGDVL